MISLLLELADFLCLTLCYIH